MKKIILGLTFLITTAIVTKKVKESKIIKSSVYFGGKSVDEILKEWYEFTES